MSHCLPVWMNGSYFKVLIWRINKDFLESVSTFHCCILPTVNTREVNLNIIGPSCSLCNFYHLDWSIYLNQTAVCILCFSFHYSNINCPVKRQKQAFLNGCEKKKTLTLQGFLWTKVKHFIWSITHEAMCVIKWFCSVLKHFCVLASKVISNTCRPSSLCMIYRLGMWE